MESFFEYNISNGTHLELFMGFLGNMSASNRLQVFAHDFPRNEFVIKRYRELSMLSYELEMLSLFGGE